MSASVETAKPASGPISRMVAEETASIQATLESLRAAWDARACHSAALCLDRLSEQLERHMRWEEESLFEELELRAKVPELRRVRAHHVGHEALARSLAHVALLLTRYEDAPEDLDTGLEVELCNLEKAVREHSARELDEICCPLDNALEPTMVEMIHTELVERGRARRSVS